jgi:hypothetical protein
MRRLSARHLYAGDVLHGVGDGDVKSRTVRFVSVDGDWVQVRFENGDLATMQTNSYFRIESFKVPFEERAEMRDEFRQALRDSQRHFPVSRGSG